MNIRFLLDENIPPKLKTAFMRRCPTIDVLRVGDTDAPPLGTLDPEVLLYVEKTQRILVTNNRKSMPGHVADHFAAGRHHWGIFNIRDSASIVDLIEALELVWGASTADEWKDKSDWIP